MLTAQSGTSLNRTARADRGVIFQFPSGGGDLTADGEGGQSSKGNGDFERWSKLRNRFAVSFTAFLNAIGPIVSDLVTGK